MKKIIVMQNLESGFWKAMEGEIGSFGSNVFMRKDKEEVLEYAREYAIQNTPCILSVHRVDGSVLYQHVFSSACF